MTTPIRLTAKQVECLRDANAAWGRSRGQNFINGWNYGSTTIAVLKRNGLIIRAHETWPCTGYYITNCGRAWLAQEGKNGRE